MKVVVLLHIQVDEYVRRALDGLFIQWAQALLQALDGTIDVPWVELGHHGRSLDGNVGDLWVLDQVERALCTGAGLVLAQNCLAQQVEVEVLTGFGCLIQHLVQGLGLSVQNEVAYHLAHAQACQRHDQVRQNGAKETTHANQGAVDKA